MTSFTCTIAACAGAFALVVAFAVCRTLIFTHTERANALRSLHTRLAREEDQGQRSL